MIGSSLPPPRSWLFVPGAAERFVAKLGNLPASARPDAVIFDLEDGVATGELSEARHRVSAITAEPRSAPWLPAIVAVRTHAFSHPAFDDDLLALGPGVTTLLLPKVDSASEVAAAAARLAASGLPHVGIVATIESAAGLEDLTAIVRSVSPADSPGGPGLQAVAFGAEDFAADLGLPPWTAAGQSDVSGGVGGGVGGEMSAAVSGDLESSHLESSHLESGRLAVLDAARARIVTAAAGAGVAWRIDTPALSIEDVRQVETAARRSRGMGFNGKLAIHPSHVEPLHRGFEPAASEVAWARAVLGISSSARSGGAGLVAGQMVDGALARQARAILAGRRLSRGSAR